MLRSLRSLGCGDLTNPFCYNGRCCFLKVEQNDKQVVCASLSDIISGAWPSPKDVLSASFVEGLESSGKGRSLTSRRVMAGCALLLRSPHKSKRWCCCSARLRMRDRADGDIRSGIEQIKVPAGNN